MTFGEIARQHEARQEALARTNPLFGPRRLKLGTFCTNVSGAATMSSMDGVFETTWDNVRTVSRLADEMEFEAIVPLGRWRGFGGVTDFNENVFEAMTFSAAVTAQTCHPSVFATIHVPTMHPVLAAKQATTIDHIGGGRFTLNVVTGWNRREIELFGSPMLDHAERYLVADEWITLMKLLWTSEEEFEFSGKYFNIKEALLRPRPIQPYPALMNASGSPVGKRFAAKHFDIVFTPPGGRDPDAIRAQLDNYRTFAREEFGREIKVWINAYVIVGDTEADAQRQFDHCVHEKGDWVAADNFINGMGIDSRSLPPEVLENIRVDMIAGYGGYRLLGTKEQVADELKMLVGAGVDGILLTWPAFIDGMQRFQREVYPLLVQEGLR
ncbi:MAG: LLM class flavin-dependent oxidoreductase [Alphaproteobacteria bacterium]|nr:LLM class flavin-dependent oxidoreductase [Alphaproteobacteria bacterium]